MHPTNVKAYALDRVMEVLGGLHALGAFLGVRDDVIRHSMSNASALPDVTFHKVAVLVLNIRARAYECVASDAQTQ